MRTLSFSLLLWSLAPAFGQQLINRRVLSGDGSDQPRVVAIDSNGFVYVAGNTTSANFPTTNALESQPPQGALEVSVSGAPFVNTGFSATSVSALAASSDGTLVLASTPGGIFRSTNQGVTWTGPAEVLPPAAALAIDPVNPSNAYAFLQNGAFYKSTNGGVNWQATGASLPATPLTEMAAAPGPPGALYTLVNNVMYRSTDGAKSWQPLSFPYSYNSIAAFALAPSQPNIIYAATASIYSLVFMSTDGGTTWTEGATVLGFGGGALAVDPANPSTVWLVNGSGNILRSTNDGGSFQTVTAVSNAGFLSIAVDPANSSRVYASTYSSVLETSNGGQTWSTVYSGIAPSLYAAPSRIYIVGASVPQTVFLTKFDAALSQVIYSTYLVNGAVTGIAIDSAGDVYVVGTQGDNGLAFNGFFVKVRADDGLLLYSTVLNGAVPYAIAFDVSGNTVIAGGASGLTATKGAYQSAPPSTCAGQNSNPIDSIPISEMTHAFVAKFNTGGALIYATYIAGSCGDAAFGLALDSSGDTYLAGETYSVDFPVTRDAMTAKFPTTGSSGFVSKLSASGDQLLYSSFVGGGDFTAAHTLALDSAGNVYLAGSTQSTPTPGSTTALPAGIGPGCLDSNSIVPVVPPDLPVGDNPFVMKMTLSAAPPVFLATFGGSCRGEADFITLDAAGHLWLSGWNQSWDFPLAAPINGLGDLTAQQLDYIGSIMGFLAELSPTGSAVLSATVTDSYGSVTADSTAVYYAGGLGDLSSSGAFTSNYAALVAQINPAQTTPIFIDEITQLNPLGPPSSLLPSAVAPGEIVRIVGRGIGPQNQAGAKLTAGGTLATWIGGVTVTFNGVPAPLVSAQANLVVAIAPFELSGLTSASVQVEYNGLTSNTYEVPVVPQNPDILAAVNSDWTANSQSNPATNGVTLFLTGLGQTNPPGVDGAINQPPLAQPVTTPPVSFTGDYNAVVTFLGAAAYEAAGVSQLNLTLTGPTVPVFSGTYTLGVQIGAETATIYVQ